MTDESDRGAAMRERQEVDPTYDEEIGAWFAKSRPFSAAQMEQQTFRFHSLPSASGAFIDSVVPGHERVLHGAVGGSKYKKLKAAVLGAQYTNIDYITAEPGNGASLHSHDVEETFICLNGRWAVEWGDEGEERLELDQYDGVVVPAGVMRSFENISNSDALLLAIVGGDDPGHVVWAEGMREPLRDA